MESRNHTEEKESYEERRMWERYPIRAKGKLILGKKEAEAHIINLSTAGALVAVLKEMSLKERAKAVLEINAENQEEVVVKGFVAHVKDHYVGLDFRNRGGKDPEPLRALIEKIDNEEE